MKYIKRIILTLTLLMLLIGGLVFSVSAADEESVLSFELEGTTHNMSYPSDWTWTDLINDDRGAIYLSDGSRMLWGTDDDGYVVADVVNAEGVRHKYRLVDTSASSVGEFITAEHVVFNSVPYITTVGIEIGISGADGVYLFKYPSYVRTWADVIAEDIYYHPDLGYCGWAISDGYIALYVSVDTVSVKYIPYAVNAGDDDVDEKFTVNSELFPYGIARAGRWVFCGPHSHNLVIVDKLEPGCYDAGYIEYACTDCNYTSKEKLLPVGCSYAFVDCYTPMTCTVCGHQDGDAVGHDLNALGNCKRCNYSTAGEAVGNLGGAIENGWNNLIGGSSSGDGGTEDKKDLWDYIAGLFPGNGSFGDGGINTTLDGISRILSIGLIFVLFLVLFPLLKPLFQLLGDLISNGVQALTSGVRSLSRRLKSKKRKQTKEKS